MKNPLRYSKLFVNAILLLTTPALIAYPQSDVLTTIHARSSFAGKGAVMQQLLTNDGLLSYDAVLRFLDEIENGDLEEAVLSTEEWNTIKNFLAFLAMEGTMPDASQEEKDDMERDIQELFNPNINSNNEENESFAKTVYFPYQMGEYTIVPAVFYGQRDIILCKKGWIAKQWKHCKKFVKEHKKAVIVGVVLVVAAVAIIVTSGAATPAAAGAVEAAAGSLKDPAHKESKEAVPTPVFQSTVEDQASSLKDTVVQNNLLPVISSNENNGENARIVGSALAHETIGSVSNSSSMPYLYGDTGNYERAIIAGHGKIDKAFSTEEAGHYINGEVFDDSTLSLQENVYRIQGEQSLKQGRYEQAVCNFEKVIDLNPHNNEVYLDRAYAYLGTGEYDHSLTDYRAYTKQKEASLSVDDVIDVLYFNNIIEKNLTKAAIKSGSEIIAFVPGAVAHPFNAVRDVYKAFTVLGNLARSQEWGTVCHLIAPEASQLVDKWNSLSVEEQADGVVFVISKIGCDIVVPGAMAKAVSLGVKSIKELSLVAKITEAANKTYVLQKAFSKSHQTFAEVSTQLRTEGKVGNFSKELTTFHNGGTLVEKSAFELESIENFKKAKAFLKPYQGQYLSENQVRTLINQSGIKTFPRPAGIPENFKVKLSNKGAGMLYVHPENEGTFIRVMPGKLHSPNLSQRKPYVVQMKDGKILDKFGKQLLREDPEAHIPLEEFVYRSN